MNSRRGVKHNGGKLAEIKRLLAEDPAVPAREIARLVGCSYHYACQHASLFAARERYEQETPADKLQWRARQFSRALELRVKVLGERAQEGMDTAAISEQMRWLLGSGAFEVIPGGDLLRARASQVVEVCSQARQTKAEASRLTTINDRLAKIEQMLAGKAA